MCFKCRKADVKCLGSVIWLECRKLTLSGGSVPPGHNAVGCGCLEMGRLGCGAQGRIKFRAGMRFNSVLGEFLGLDLPSFVRFTLVYEEK